MNSLTRDGTAEPVPRDQILGRERGQGNIHFPCSADHEQDSNWQPYLVDSYSCYMCDHTYIKGCVRIRGMQIVSSLVAEPAKHPNSRVDCVYTEISMILILKTTSQKCR